MNRGGWALACCALLVAGVILASSRRAPVAAHGAAPVAASAEPLLVEGLSEPEIVVGRAQMGALDGPLQELPDLSAPGGWALTVPEGPNHEKLHDADKDDGKGGQVPNGTAAFAFTVETPGEYVLWAHKRWCCSCGDSFRYALDGGPLQDFQTDSNYGVWEWAARKDARVHLEKGAHTLLLANREDGFRVSRFLLTTGEQTPAPPKP